MSVRKTASPSKLLVSRSEDLSGFFNRLGRVMYGADWRSQPDEIATSQLDEHAGTAYENSSLVRSQIIGGIIERKIQIEMRIVTEAYEKKLTRFTDRIVRDEGDDVHDGEHPWAISDSYWASNPQFDWKSSTISISADLIVSRNGDGSLSQHYDVSLLTVPIRVLRPDETLRKMFDLSELPDDAWFARYDKYTKSSTREAVAVAWRYIAITRLENKHGVQAKLVEAMRNHLDFHHLKLSDAALAELANKIVKQLKSGDLTGPIFVNSVRQRLVGGE